MGNNNESSGIWGLLLAAYIVVAEIMAVVFFIRYCRVDSIAEIIFIDTILSEIKGLLWIFFIW